MLKCSSELCLNWMKYRHLMTNVLPYKPLYFQPGSQGLELGSKYSGSIGATMSAKSLGTFPVICAIDEVQNSLPLKTMLFKRHMTSIIGISDTFPNS